MSDDASEESEIPFHEKIPESVWIVVFSFLPPREIYTTSRTCIYFRVIINNTYPMDFWRDLCRADFPTMWEHARTHSILSWREMYNSLRLWPKLREAAVFFENEKDLGAFNIAHLPGGRIGYPTTENLGSDADLTAGTKNCITVYDTVSLQKLSKHCTASNFKMYYEDAEYIIYEYSVTELEKPPEGTYGPDRLITIPRLRVAHKSHINTSVEYINVSISYMVVYDKDVYFQRGVDEDSCNLYRIRVTLEPSVGGHRTIFVTEKLCNGINGCMLAITKVGGDPRQLKLVRLDPYRMFSFVGVRNRLISSFVEWKPTENRDVIAQLHRHGFSWTVPRILHWMCMLLSWIDMLKVQSIFCAFDYGDVIAVNTRGKTKEIRIFYSSVPRGGAKDITDEEPTLRIPVPGVRDDEDSFDRSMFTVSQENLMNVIEIEYGHRVLCIYGNTLYIVNLVHRSEAVFDRSVEVWLKEREKRLKDAKAAKKWEAAKIEDDPPTPVLRLRGPPARSIRSRILDIFEPQPSTSRLYYPEQDTDSTTALISPCSQQSFAEGIPEMLLYRTFNDPSFESPQVESYSMEVEACIEHQPSPRHAATSPQRETPMHLTLPRQHIGPGDDLEVLPDESPTEPRRPLRRSPDSPPAKVRSLLGMTSLRRLSKDKKSKSPSKSPEKKHREKRDKSASKSPGKKDLFKRKDKEKTPSKSPKSKAKKESENQQTAFETRREKGHPPRGVRQRMWARIRHASEELTGRFMELRIDRKSRERSASTPRAGVGPLRRLLSMELDVVSTSTACSVSQSTRTTSVEPSPNTPKKTTGATGAAHEGRQKPSGSGLQRQPFKRTSEKPPAGKRPPERNGKDGRKGKKKK